MAASREEVLAFAIYEIRLLLAGNLCSESESPLSIRTAAHLAYALHDEADAALEGRPFSLENAERRIGAVDRMLGSDLRDRMARAVAREA